MTSPVALLVAKAPVPGLVKTRLARDVGPARAAELAAAAFLDTIDACEAAFEHCHVALDGELADARCGREIAARLSTWDLHAQSGGDLGRRLAMAHREVGRVATGPVVQVGMDTPQLAEPLGEVADLASSYDAVLGPATDGGWWVLALQRPGVANALGSVRMSTPHTHLDTLTALRSAGARVVPAAELVDVDTAADAQLVAGLAAGSRFAAAWDQLR